MLEKKCIASFATQTQFRIAIVVICNFYSIFSSTRVEMHRTGCSFTLQIVMRYQIFPTLQSVIMQWFLVDIVLLFPLF